MMATFICIASGPSLTADDCTLARDSGHPIIAVNTSFKAIPDCQYIYAADFSWWEKHYREIQTSAELWTSSVSAAIHHRLNFFSHPDNESFNSGQRAIQLAVQQGARRIILLGYDCDIEAGTHWHGDHPSALKNPDNVSVSRWHVEFSRLVPLLDKVEILNCSRRSALTCFPISTFETALYA